MFNRKGSSRIGSLLIAGAIVLTASFVIAGESRTNAQQGTSTPPAATIDRLDASTLDVMTESLLAEVPAAADGRVTTVPLAADGISPLPNIADVEAESAFVLSRIADERDYKLYFATRSGSGDAGSAGCPTAATVSLIACSERETQNGVETTETYVSVALPEAGAGKYIAIDPAKVTAAMAADLRVERVVRLHLPGGGKVSAWETVYGVSNTDDLEAAFVEADSLVALVHDVTLLQSLRGQ